MGAESGTFATYLKNGKICFTPTTPAGTVKVKYTVTGRDMRGHSVITHTTLLEVTDDGDKTIDVIDATNAGEQQTVHYPLVTTEAIDKDTQWHEGDGTPDDGVVTVTDIIKYENVLPGRARVVKAQLYDADTHEPLAGADYTTEFEFTPASPNGYETVDFDIAIADTEHAEIKFKCGSCGVKASDLFCSAIFCELAFKCLRLGAGCYPT
jgi:hypothetical protein